MLPGEMGGRIPTESEKAISGLLENVISRYFEPSNLGMRKGRGDVVCGATSGLRRGNKRSRKGGELIA